jgi:hypothetical protein
VSPDRRPGADQTRFTHLAETAGPRVLAYLTRRIDPPGDAADVLAEVLAIAWRRVADLPADEGRRRPGCSGSPGGRSPTTDAGRPGAMRWQTGCATTLPTANAKRHRRPTRSSPSATRSAG